MADVFITYAGPDRARVRVIAEALVGQGLSVWWDPAIEEGAVATAVIERRLAGARCVLAVWSHAAESAPWVAAQAQAGAARGALALARLDAAPAPSRFPDAPIDDLSSWRGDPTAPDWRRLLSRIFDLAAAETRAAPRHETLSATPFEAQNADPSAAAADADAAAAAAAAKPERKREHEPTPSAPPSPPSQSSAELGPPPETAAAAALAPPLDPPPPALLPTTALAATVTDPASPAVATAAAPPALPTLAQPEQREPLMRALIFIFLIGALWVAAFRAQDPVLSAATTLALATLLLFRSAERALSPPDRALVHLWASPHALRPPPVADPTAAQAAEAALASASKQDADKGAAAAKNAAPPARRLRSPVSSPTAFLALFRALFGERHVSRRSFARSAAVSSLGFIILLIIIDFWTEDRIYFQIGADNHALEYFLLLLLLNILGGYIALGPSRVFFRLSARSRLLTAALLPISALAPFTVFIATLFGLGFLLFHFQLSGLHLSPQQPYPQSIDNAMLLAAISSAYIAPLWLWLMLLLGPGSRRALRRASCDAPLLARAVGVDRSPLAALSFVMALAILCLGGLVWALTALARLVL